MRPSSPEPPAGAIHGERNQPTTPRMPRHGLGLLALLVLLALSLSKGSLSKGRLSKGSNPKGVVATKPEVAAPRPRDFNIRRSTFSIQNSLFPPKAQAGPQETVANRPAGA